MNWPNGGSDIRRKIFVALGAPHGSALREVAETFLAYACFEDGDGESIEGGPNTLHVWYREGFEFFIHGDPYAKVPVIEIRVNATARTKKNNPVVFEIRDKHDVRHFWTIWVPEQRRQQMIANIHANSLHRKQRATA
jgi:hypothetical protein